MCFSTANRSSTQTELLEGKSAIRHKAVTMQGRERVQLLTEMLAKDGLFLLAEVGAYFKSRGITVLPDRRTINRELLVLEESGQVKTATVSLLNKTNSSKTDYTVVYMPSRYPGGAGDGFMAKARARCGLPRLRVCVAFFPRFLVRTRVAACESALPLSHTLARLGDKSLPQVNERLREHDAQRPKQQQRLRDQQPDPEVQVVRMNIASAKAYATQALQRARSAGAVPGGVGGAMAPGGPLQLFSQQGIAAMQQQADNQRLATVRAFLQRYCGFLRYTLPMLMELHVWLFRHVALGKDVSPDDMVDGIPFDLDQVTGEMPVVTALRISSLEGAATGLITAETVEQWLRPEVSGGRLADLPDRHLITTEGFRQTLLRVVEMGSHVGVFSLGAPASAAGGDGAGAAEAAAAAAAAPAPQQQMRLMLHLCYQRVSPGAVADGSAARVREEGRAVPSELLEWVPVELKVEADVRAYWDGLKATFVDQSGVMDEAFPVMLVPEARARPPIAAVRS